MAGANRIEHIAQYAHDGLPANDLYMVGDIGGLMEVLAKCRSQLGIHAKNLPGEAELVKLLGDASIPPPNTPAPYQRSCAQTMDRR
ncbi:hypothetical protein ABIC75_004556 [Dyella japonica]|uniref:Uncharacterized protein n=1 Tax=Dyella japonica TaxID=231455 RepID=A0ABV2K156_9GAMM